MKQYLKKQEGVSTPLATKWRPRFSSNDLTRSEAGENPDVLVDGVWYNSTNGSELVTNGTFDTDTSGWTAVGSNITNYSGALKVTTVSGYGFAEQAVSVVTGTTYKIKFSLNQRTGTQAGLYIDKTSGALSGDYIYNTGISLNVGNYEEQFTATQPIIYLKLVTENVSSYTTIWDNISVFETNIEPSTAYTTPQTYLPIVANVDEQGNIVDIDSFDVPTLVEKSITAETVNAETKGKNSCTAWVNFDSTTTPPTIRDSYNVSQVIRTAAGNFDIYFEEEMDNTSYTLSGISGTGAVADANVYSLKLLSPDTNKTTTKVSIGFRYVSTYSGNVTDINIQVFGGKN